MNTLDVTRNIINSSVPRSAWDEGVKLYALELLAGIAERAADEGRAPDVSELEAWALNGAQDWTQYSEGGNALVYSGDIAARLCSPSELRRTRGGERNPNWLGCQARALGQAYKIVRAAWATAAPAATGAEKAS